jgi:hypothetical protein
MISSNNKCLIVQNINNHKPLDFDLKINYAGSTSEQIFYKQWDQFSQVLSTLHPIAM